jgi:xanthine/uracil permease
MADGDGRLVYAPEESPRSARDWALYSAQWVVTMFYAVVWGYIIVGLALGFEGADFARYMSSVVLMIGVATLAQVWFGHRFAMVSGPNIIPSLAIVAALAAGGREYALHAFTAQAIAGVVIVVLALVGVLSWVKRVWSPLVLGSMVMMVGLAVAVVGLEQLVADGLGWPFWVGLALALGGTMLAIRGRGVWATLPPLLVIGVGYAIFLLAGAVDLGAVRDTPLLVTPGLFPYGFAMPPLDLVLIMIVVNLMAALNLYGNVTGYAEVVGEKVPEARTKRSFAILGGVETTLAGVLGVPATVPYGENLGIVLLTRVAARAFILVAAVVFISLAFLGPMGALMANMPGPVAGAVLLGIASTVVGIGADVMSKVPAFGRREQTLVGFSVFLALGLYLLPAEVWDAVPRLVATIFQNPVISVILFVMLFEQVLFRRSRHAADRPDKAAPAGEEGDGGERPRKRTRPTG